MIRVQIIKGELDQTRAWAHEINRQKEEWKSDGYEIKDHQFINKDKVESLYQSKISEVAIGKIIGKPVNWEIIKGNDGGTDFGDWDVKFSWYKRILRQPDYRLNKCKGFVATFGLAPDPEDLVEPFYREILGYALWEDLIRPGNLFKQRAGNMAYELTEQELKKDIDWIWDELRTGDK